MPLRCKTSRQQQMLTKIKYIINIKSNHAQSTHIQAQKNKRKKEKKPYNNYFQESHKAYCVWSLEHMQPSPIQYLKHTEHTV